MTKRNKNIALIFGFALMVIIAYQFAFAETLRLRKSHMKLEQEQLAFENTPQRISILKQKERYYDSILNANNIGSSSLQNELLKTLSSFDAANDLKVSAFVAPHIFNEKDYKVITYSFSVTGSFNNIQKLLYHIEQKTAFGELVNVHYTKKRDFRRRRNYLEAAVLLRRFER
ncbi:hypothetical protein [Spongiivirga citrea]|uniref:Uncharacterized protein n=1 Tax=Spongiivirga citrea TaxID=1481457 RepID=A0A6M0CMR2_9FLAO|nr:hypothetical protein [Spongiivirga citrea]NER16767.1 hypothetical protein [Spongiivirga citrea]